MKEAVAWLLAISFLVTPPVVHAQWTGNSSVIGRAYPGKLPAGGERRELTFEATVRRVWSWGDGGRFLTISPRIRLDPGNHGRSQLDGSDLLLELIWANTELAVGVATLNWSLAESVPLVDVVNQQDFGEDRPSPERLGQPMIHTRRFWTGGAVELLLLPLFRKRQFEGRGGALWSLMRVEKEFTRPAEPRSTLIDDWALRLTQTVGTIDLGLAYLDGTNRQPTYSHEVPVGQTSGVLVPMYNQMRQASVDAQWTLDAWIIKVEGLRRVTDSETFHALVAGVEYAFANYLSVFFEYAYDERGAQATTSFENDAFVGARLLTQEWTVTGRTFIDTRSANVIASATVSRRLGSFAAIDFKGRVFSGHAEDEPGFANRRDGYGALQLRYFF
jgi:hypothetical protein